MEKKLVLKISPNNWANASRDKRELETCRELGCDVAVIAKGNPGDKGRIEKVSNFSVYRVSTRPLGKIVPAQINRIVSLFTWAKFASSLKPHVISGHDIKGLLIGWITNFFLEEKASLVYDSHEFEIGRNVKRNTLQIWWVTHLERFLIKRAAFSIMVNDSIADEVQRIHKLTKRPVVVRSMPTKWELSDEQIRIRRDEFEKKLGYPKWIIMYHGLLAPGRGVENVIDVAAGIPEVGVVILGDPSTPEYYDKLKRYALERQIYGRVYFHRAVPFEELKSFVAAADVGMIISDVPTKSYYFGLPNKFFENIQAETPIVASDLPEMTRIIKQYDIGLICQVGDVEEARKCVSSLLMDHELYIKFKSNLALAKAELCWEREKHKLSDAYRMVLKV